MGDDSQSPCLVNVEEGAEEPVEEGYEAPLASMASGIPCAPEGTLFSPFMMVGPEIQTIRSPGELGMGPSWGFECGQAHVVEVGLSYPPI